MPPRTLVIGIPLPHASFDNYSFISAPSICEYSRLIFDIQAVSQAVDEVTEGSGQHSTFDGQPVVNAETPARAFALSGLLSMRRREAARFFDHGGTAACIAYPDARHAGIAGVDSWGRYEWLPQPAEAPYTAVLLPGFGTAGAEVTAAEHPFAQYVAELGPRLAYRACLDEAVATGATVIGRSSAGVPIAFEVKAGRGRIVFLPPVRDFANDRARIGEVLFNCFERLEKAEPPSSAVGQGFTLPDSGDAGPASSEQPADEAPGWMRREVG
ncbi:MAG: hypothetical protein E6J42_09105 [Chloroflexi bacterium]|nr:MAG: hypothetical protein E6J42_09105 [Chloroflexota bacterium]